MSSLPAWAKVTHNGVNKRIAHPSPNLSQFRAQLLKHFRLSTDAVRLFYDSQSLFDQSLDLSQYKDSSLESKRLVNSQADYAQLMEKHRVYRRNDGSFTTPRFVVELDQDRMRGQSFASKVFDQTADSIDHFSLVESFEISDPTKTDHPKSIKP